MLITVNKFDLKKKNDRKYLQKYVNILELQWLVQKSLHIDTFFLKLCVAGSGKSSHKGHLTSKLNFVQKGSPLTFSSHFSFISFHILPPVVHPTELSCYIFSGFLAICILFSSNNKNSRAKMPENAKTACPSLHAIILAPKRAACYRRYKTTPEEILRINRHVQITRWKSV